MSFSPHLVSLVGAPSSGVTTLARAVAGLIETSDAFLTTSAKDTSRHARLAEIFRQSMAAVRNVADARGAVVDGSIACELLLIDLDLQHGRLTCATSRPNMHTTHHPLPLHKGSVTRPTPTA